MASFTITAVVTGVVCYSLGLIFGWYVNRSSRNAEIRKAYQQGEENAVRAHNEEKARLGEELSEKLTQMRDTLISSFEAYEEAVKTVDSKLSPGIRSQLSIGFDALSLEGRESTKALPENLGQANGDKITLSQKVEKEVNTTPQTLQDQTTNIFDTSDSFDEESPFVSTAAPTTSSPSTSSTSTSSTLEDEEDSEMRSQGSQTAINIQ
ncbi:MAG: hypothetical protein KDD60_00110 [Bdellovibrionales bacterium]|nr:hypothetical protein [Bdellovibrionales bacterium]